MLLLLNASDMSLGIGYKTRNTCYSNLLDQVIAGVVIRGSAGAGINYVKVLAQLLQSCRYENTVRFVPEDSPLL